MTLNRPKGLFITGTDTAVGKTFVTQRILQQLNSQSISCVAMKPIASGAIQTDNGLRNDDALKLQQACNVTVPYELLNPYCFEPAIAPHLAAQQSGIVIQSKVILDAFHELCLLADVVLVEGVGGWQVPLNTDAENVLSVASLAAQMKLPIVMVVGLRLGCINHALLTYQAIQNSSCSMAGWVANEVDTQFSTANDCVATLKKQIFLPLLANLPWCQEPNFLKNNQKMNTIFDLDQLFPISKRSI